MNSELSNYTITLYELLENGFDIGLKDYEISGKFFAAFADSV